MKLLTLLLLLPTLLFSKTLYSSSLPDGIYVTQEEIDSAKPSLTFDEYVLNNVPKISLLGLIPKKDTIFTPDQRYYTLRKVGTQEQRSSFKRVELIKKGQDFYINAGGNFSKLHQYESYSWHWYEATFSGAVPDGVGNKGNFSGTGFNGTSSGTGVKNNLGAYSKDLVWVIDNMTKKGMVMNITKTKRFIQSKPSLLRNFENETYKKPVIAQYIDRFLQETSTSGQTSSGKRDTQQSKTYGTTSGGTGPATLVLKNGDKISGTITSETSRIYTINTSSGSMNIMKSSVQKRIDN